MNGSFKIFKISNLCFTLQKQSPEGVLQKKCSKEFRKIHRKTIVLKSLFNKIATFRPATLLNSSASDFL